MFANDQILVDEATGIATLTDGATIEGKFGLKPKGAPKGTERVMVKYTIDVDGVRVVDLLERLTGGAIRVDIQNSIRTDGPIAEGQHIRMTWDELNAKKERAPRDPVRTMENAWKSATPEQQATMQRMFEAMQNAQGETTVERGDIEASQDRS